MAVAVSPRIEAPIGELRAFAYTVPTDRAESDGTFSWDSTTLVLVEVDAEGETGIGWTYCAPAAAQLIVGPLADIAGGLSALDIGGVQLALRAALRNAGYSGIGACAVSAIDVALHDLKAKLLDLPLVSLLGAVHDEVPLYGSGGFCSYSNRELAEQLSGWVDAGIPRVKMKIGREPGRDLERVRVAREAIGPEAELYVDANGALTVKKAASFAAEIEELGVTWFEEPVSSFDLDGLTLLRTLVPPGMEIAAGEYAYAPADFRDLIDSVDCLQADVTRCGGITGLVGAGALAAAHELDLSGHTAPAIHTHALCALPKLRHLEWFHDHVRIERLFFDGFPEPEGGIVRPDRSRPGLGVELRRADAAQYLV